MFYFDKEPDFVNELGVKWWKDKSTTQYAQKPDAHGTTLEVTCWLIEQTDKNRMLVLLSKSGEIIETDTTLEGMGSKIDIRKILKHFDSQEYLELTIPKKKEK